MTLIMAISSLASVSASAFSNYSDRSFDTGYHAIADSTTYYNVGMPCTDINPTTGVYNVTSPYGYRAKCNATGTYIYNQSGSAFKFRVCGSSSILGYDLFPNDSRKVGRVEAGQMRLFRQWVYENGHGYCGLYAASIYDNSRATGLWSPDSIGSFSYCND